MIFLDGHIELIGNNLKNKTAGETDYLEQLNVGTPYSTYFPAGSGACILTTFTFDIDLTGVYGPCSLKYTVESINDILSDEVTVNFTVEGSSSSFK